MLLCMEDKIADEIPNVLAHRPANIRLMGKTHAKYLQDKICNDKKAREFLDIGDGLFVIVVNERKEIQTIGPDTEGEYSALLTYSLEDNKNTDLIKQIITSIEAESLKRHGHSGNYALIVDESSMGILPVFEAITDRKTRRIPDPDYKF